MSAIKAIEAFEKEVGTIEDYGNDKTLWREHFGTFFLGWLACEKNAQQSVRLTALRRGLALSILFNVVLLAVVLATIGGR